MAIIPGACQSLTHNNQRRQLIPKKEIPRLPVRICNKHLRSRSTLSSEKTQARRGVCKPLGQRRIQAMLYVLFVSAKAGWNLPTPSARTHARLWRHKTSPPQAMQHDFDPQGDPRLASSSSKGSAHDSAMPRRSVSGSAPLPALPSSDQSSPACTKRTQLVNVRRLIYQAFGR